MLNQFLDFINKEKLITPSPLRWKTESVRLGGQGEGQGVRCLLTVSGGVDSVVMCSLFHEAGFSFGIAHCNFKLRGKESEKDERFVKSLAEKYHVPFHSKSFNTSSYSKRKKISIQMAARELRYDWLKRLAKEKRPARHQNESMMAGGYDLIATAHHLDDSIETFFINILRGTGISGLHGIHVKNGNVIRPLMFANKKMIRGYAEKQKLEWREDRSNFTDKYLRNNIRHHLIPSLKKLNRGFEKTITKELSYFRVAGEIFKTFIEEKKKEIVVEKGKNILLSIKKLKDSGYAGTVLHELLRAYDFTPETTELIAQRMYTAAGKKFFSPTYRLIKDRDFLILTPKNSAEKETTLFLKKGQTEFKNEDLHLKIEIIRGNLPDIKDKSSAVAYLDYSALVFPLKIRKWKQGDFFFPLGMTGKKKLSDFFIDEKIPISEKENIYVLESKRKIAWVINHRIDNRFKVLPETRTILRLSPPLGKIPSL